MTADVWLERAARAIATARLALVDGDPAAASNRAYYAIFYTARAALIAVGQAERAEGKTHSGIISAFHEFAVKPGVVPASVGPLFTREFKRRVEADYEGEDVSPASGQDAIANAQAFLDQVSVALKR